MNNNDEIWQSALHMLAYRSHSEQELRQKLCHKNYTIDQIDDVMNRLLIYGYLNDTELAKILFTKYSQVGKYSLKAIIYKLRQRGLSNDIIENIINSFDSETELQSAFKIVNNRFKTSKEVTKERIYRFLATRGFSTTTITKVLQQIHPSEFE